MEEKLNSTQKVARDSMDKFIPVLKNQVLFYLLNNSQYLSNKFIWRTRPQMYFDTELNIIKRRALCYVRA